MVETMIKVKNMGCAACASKIDAAVLKVAGVTRAVADHATKEVVVEYDETKTTLDAIKAAIEEIGYTPEN